MVVPPPRTTVRGHTYDSERENGGIYGAKNRLRVLRRGTEADAEADATCVLGRTRL